MATSTLAQAGADPLFPSGYFAMVPDEVLSPLAHVGPHALSHAQFRLLCCLLRFRGPRRVINPTRATMARMTGIAPHNISRLTHELMALGWLTIHYEAGKKCRKVENYELHLPTPTAAEVQPVPGTNPKAKVREQMPLPLEPMSAADPDDVETWDEVSPSFYADDDGEFSMVPSGEDLDEMYQDSV